MSAPNLRGRPDICVVGPQNGPLCTHWWETKAPDRAVTGQSLGVERRLCQHRSPAAVFLEKADLPFPEGSLECALPTRRWL